MKEIKELRPKVLEDYIEEQKKQFKELFDTDNVKLVGLTFHFLIDEEMLTNVRLYSKGFNPEDFEN
ncbi:MAG TPA: hypothetical protein ENG63_07480 [Candidatus Desulfofervidus auxilii]|uniref:Uncharacterized protein n=1 Tax=Desulfofervidus auxilii TaxID=1621989 RepID=A0A7C0U3D6_DESA2|nr:hypothetical protein [Candidatus Desulfofervidus auxilii]